MSPWKVFLAFIVLLVGACGGSGSGGSRPGDTHYVQYEVSSYSGNPLTIAYMDEQGQIEELTDVLVADRSWRYAFYAEAGTRLYLSASLEGDSSEIFYVAIYVDSVRQETMSQKGGMPAVIEFTVPDG